MNLILMISDTLRRDHLSCYGNARIHTPNLHELAQQGLVFEDCYPASFPTIPARADIMTGRYTFLYQDWGPLAQSETTMAECLTQAGYTTMGVADTPFVQRNGYGYDRGFQDFIYIRGQRGGHEKNDVYSMMRLEKDRFAPQTVLRATEWLERHYKEQFFLYVDTWDPHEPWDPPAYYVTPYLPDYDGRVVPPVYWDYREDGLTEREIEIAHACYCGEISMVDRWFGYLMERVRTLGLLDNTAIVFASDHGFYFGEHGLFGKRRFRWADQILFEKGFEAGRREADGFIYRSPLHNEVTQVPLIIYLPGEQPRRISGLVTLPDLMPTLLELAGASVPDTVQAKSLLPLIRGDSRQVHKTIFTAAPLEDLGKVTQTVDDLKRMTKEYSPTSITDGEWDLLYAVHGEPVELYRTREDRGHMNNLFGSHRDVAERLHNEYVTWLEALQVPESLVKPRREL